MVSGFFSFTSDPFAGKLLLDNIILVSYIENFFGGVIRTNNIVLHDAVLLFILSNK